MRAVVLYHGEACPDGFTAAWIARRELLARGYEVNAIPVLYQQPLPLEPLRGVDEVYIVDFSYPQEDLLAAEERARLVVLDHHKTAFDQLVGINDRFVNTESIAVFDMQSSGASLAAAYFDLQSAYQWLSDYVRDGDLYHFRLENSREINAYIAAVPQTFDAWDRLVETPREVCVEQGRGALLHAAAYVRTVAANARFARFGGHYVPIVNAPRPMISELLDRLAPSHPFAVGWCQLADGRFKYSLRSRGATALDVSKVAEQFGGGGHEHAASFVSYRMVETT